jgi:altronate dehydratase small subunit
MAFSSDLLLLAPQDNCLVARRDLPAGTVVVVDAQEVVLVHAVALGHKLARRAVAAGEKVIRWGAPIGSATQAIPRGDPVHTHNLASDYLPTYLAEGAESFVNSHAAPHAT